MTTFTTPDDLEKIDHDIYYMHLDREGDSYCTLQWQLVLRKGGKKEMFSYFTNAAKPKVFYRETEAKLRKEKWPKLWEVLWCLLMDARADEQSFGDWCSELGSDDDSIKAFRMYQACCDTAVQLRNIFTRAEIEELRNLTWKIDNGEFDSEEGGEAC